MKGQVTARRIGVAAMLGVFIVTTGCGGGEADAPGAEESTPSASASPPAEPAVSVVAIGDSIPYNSPEDCPGCTGFVDRYAEALSEATGEEVETFNFSDHTGLTLPGLLQQLPSYKDYLRDADAIIVGIAHNSIVLNEDKPCETPFDEATSTLKDWSKVTQECATRSADQRQPQFEKLYSTITSWREGRPTLLLTINKYNDWIGWRDAHLTPDQEERTAMVHNTWNQMLCTTAERNGFTCADVGEAFNGPDGTKPSGDLLAADYTHPSDSGNELIARLLIAEGLEPST